MRLAGELIFRYDTTLCAEEARVRYGLAEDVQQLVEQARLRFPDRPYQSVDIIVRNQDGARECYEILQSLGFGVYFFDERSEHIWEWSAGSPLDSRDAIQNYNQHILEHGTFSDDLRAF